MAKEVQKFEFIAELKEFVDKEKNETREYWSYSVMLPVLGGLAVPVTITDKTAKLLLQTVLEQGE